MAFAWQRAREHPAAFVRFGTAGATGLVVNMAVFAALTAGAGLHYLAAAAVSTQASTLWNFAMVDGWVFPSRAARRSRATRLVLFALMNNAALVVRGPILVGLVSGLAVNSLLANLISIACLTCTRYALSTGLIWAGTPGQRRLFRYSVHDLVTVESDVALPELVRFRTPTLDGAPTIRVRTDGQHELPAGAATVCYSEGPFGVGFGVRIALGETADVVAAPLVAGSPHVLYTNVVEPIIRWAAVRKGFAVVHGACLSRGGEALVVTARTDTGKTTTVLRTLAESRFDFLSDDLVLLAADGTVLAYPKPLTVSRHTVRAIPTARLTRRERLALVVQSRIHSRAGRRAAFRLTRARLPVASINAVVQLLVPPPKYAIERLVPDVDVVGESRLARLAIIERGADETQELPGREALQRLLENSEDAFGFPPYPAIAPFLRRWGGEDLAAAERAIVVQALEGIPAVLLRSATLNWHERLPALPKALAAPEARPARTPVPALRPA